MVKFLGQLGRTLTGSVINFMLNLAICKDFFEFVACLLGKKKAVLESNSRSD